MGFWGLGFRVGVLPNLYGGYVGSRGSTDGAFRGLGFGAWGWGL